MSLSPDKCAVKKATLKFVLCKFCYYIVKNILLYAQSYVELSYQVISGLLWRIALECTKCT